MQWNDEAIILSKTKFSEDSALVKLFSENQGLYAGILKKCDSKANRAILFQGNIVGATWKARLAEHIGQFILEPVELIGNFLISEMDKIFAIGSLCFLIANCLEEREPHSGFYSKLKQFFQTIKITQDNQMLIKSYLEMEILLLAEVGFPIDLHSCAVTNLTEDLVYISPKSGRAVSRSGAIGYEDKLFAMPEFYTNPTLAINPTEVNLAFNINEYFLTKRILSHKNKSMPNIRNELKKILQKEFNYI